MHLASISSQEENDRLEKHIRDFGKYLIEIASCRRKISLICNLTIFPLLLNDL